MFYAIGIPILCSPHFLCEVLTYKNFHTREVLGCELNIKFFMPILPQINNNAFIKLWIEEENRI